MSNVGNSRSGSAPKRVNGALWAADWLGHLPPSEVATLDEETESSTDEEGANDEAKVVTLFESVASGPQSTAVVKGPNRDPVARSLGIVGSSAPAKDGQRWRLWPF